MSDEIQTNLRDGIRMMRQVLGETIDDLDTPGVLLKNDGVTPEEDSFQKGVEVAMDALRMRFHDKLKPRKPEYNFGRGIIEHLGEPPQKESHTEFSAYKEDPIHQEIQEEAEKESASEWLQQAYDWINRQREKAKEDFAQARKDTIEQHAKREHERLRHAELANKIAQDRDEEERLAREAKEGLRESFRGQSLPNVPPSPEDFDLRDAFLRLGKEDQEEVKKTQQRKEESERRTREAKEKLRKNDDGDEFEKAREWAKSLTDDSMRIGKIEAKEETREWAERPAKDAAGADEAEYGDAGSGEEKRLAHMEEAIEELRTKTREAEAILELHREKVHRLTEQVGDTSGGEIMVMRSRVERLWRAATFVNDSDHGPKQLDKPVEARDRITALEAAITNQGSQHGELRDELDKLRPELKMLVHKRVFDVEQRMNEALGEQRSRLDRLEETVKRLSGGNTP